MFYSTFYHNFYETEMYENLFKNRNVSVVVFNKTDYMYFVVAVDYLFLIVSVFVR